MTQELPRIPLVDLGAQHAQIAAEIAAGFARVIERSAFVLGDEVEHFEREYARFCGAAHCVAVASGTDALELALRAADVGGGDEVILPANAFVATAAAVVRAGAIPVLADVDPRHLLIDPRQIAARMTPRTRAILPVHLYGQMAPMREIVALATRVGAVVIEDAAQAHGARQRGHVAAEPPHAAEPHATMAGLAAATSFYPGKNLGAYGDGGAVVTDAAPTARRLRALRNHGGEAKHEHRELGFNSRLDALQAVVLRAKLPRLAEGNAARGTAAARYDALLAAIPELTLPATLPGNEHVWHLYVIRVPRRDDVLRRLHAAGIGAAVHYPTPIHALAAFRHLRHGPGAFPVAEAAAAEVLSLPLFPEITADQQERVATTLRRALTS